MTFDSLNRWSAFALHLAVSALIAATVVGLVLVAWYPAPYFAAMGGDTLLRLLIGVGDGRSVDHAHRLQARQAAAGADLAIVAGLQVAALAYGTYVMFDARPVYNVFVKDRFETVAANGIDETSQDKAAEAFRSMPLTGPRIVAANLPKDRSEAATIMMASVTGGPDVPNLPHLYTPYGEAAAQVAKASRPLVSLSQKGLESAEAVNTFVAANGNGARSLGDVPVKARNRDFTVVVDRKTGEIVGYLAVNPW